MFTALRSIQHHHIFWLGQLRLHLLIELQHFPAHGCKIAEHATERTQIIDVACNISLQHLIGAAQVKILHRIQQGNAIRHLVVHICQYLRRLRELVGRIARQDGIDAAKARNILNRRVGASHFYQTVKRSHDVFVILHPTSNKVFVESEFIRNALQPELHRCLHFAVLRPLITQQTQVYPEGDNQQFQQQTSRFRTDANFPSHNFGFIQTEKYENYRFFRYRFYLYGMSLKTSIRYTLGAILVVPLLPLLLIDGWRIKRRIPDLPEPADTVGTFGTGRPFQLLILGESTMAGVGAASHAAGFAGSLARLLAERLDAQIHWQVHAKSGYTAREVRQQLLPAVTTPHADLIVIGIGANDAFTGNTPWRWRRHTRALIRQLRHKYPDAPILFLHMPPIRNFPALSPLLRRTIGSLAELLGQELAQTAATFPKVYFPNDPLSLRRWQQQTNGSYEQLFSDGVHPSEAAYGLWAREVVFFLTKVIDKEDIKDFD